MGKGVVICLLAIVACVQAQFQWGPPQWRQPGGLDFSNAYSSYSSLPEEAPAVAASPPGTPAAKASPSAADAVAAYEARIRAIIADELNKWKGSAVAQEAATEAPPASKSPGWPVGLGKKGWIPPWIGGDSSLWDFIQQKKAEKKAAVPGVTVESGLIADTVYPSQIGKSKKD